MKTNYAIATSMLMLALVLVGAQTHALFTSGANETAKSPALEASVIETLSNLKDYQRHDDPPVPFNRGAPDMTIH